METIALAILLMFCILNAIMAFRIKKIETDLKQSKEYNKTLSNLNDNVRGFKHDFSNILTAIGGYVYANDMNGLKKYYTDLMKDCNKINNLSTLSPDVVNNPAIYSILSNKYYVAEEYGIAFNLDIFLDLNSLNMSIYEFTRIMRYFIR